MEANEISDFLETLHARFEKNKHRHPNILWVDFVENLIAQPNKVSVLQAMEQSGGEPDVIDFDPTKKQYLVVDCSKESPVGRRSLCFDQEAWHSRKANKPTSSVEKFAQEMGAELLTEQDYFYLQTREVVDCKTSSWIQTPMEIRSLGGALFGDNRFGRVFIYHNGADSYYAARGFRVKIWV